MGDPKFSRRKYDTPSHPWRAERIKNETELQKRYGLKNKREIWKAQSMVRTLRSQSRDLQARLRTGEHQAEVEMKQLLDKCGRLGLLPVEGTTLNDVLSLSIENILSRRFQTMVFQRGLTYSPDQARQFIVHGHITINGRIVTIPGYLVRRSEENAIAYSERSPIANDLHPMRPKPKDAIEIEKEKVIAERAEKEKETPKPEEKPAEKPAPPAKKEGDKHVHLKAAKPSLEKIIEKDGAAEENAPIPDEAIEAPAEEKKPEAKPAKPAEDKKDHKDKDPKKTRKVKEHKEK